MLRKRELMEIKAIWVLTSSTVSYWVSIYDHNPAERLYIRPGQYSVIHAAVRSVQPVLVQFNNSCGPIVSGSSSLTHWPQRPCGHRRCISRPSGSSPRKHSCRLELPRRSWAG